MEIITVSLAKAIKQETPLCACIGYFDGMHCGHQSLFQKVFEYAKGKGLVPALITFDPDPWVVTKKETNIKHLMTMKERIAFGAELGFQKWIILQFDEAMASLSIEKFHALLNMLQVKCLVCGFDFHYGHFGKGSIETLQKQDDFKVIVCEEVKLLNEKISSSRIERMLEEGNVEFVTMLLGRNYIVEGVVVHGAGLGKTIGFPTANLEIDPSLLLPKSGVYAGYAYIANQRYQAILNIGHNPTFNLKAQLSFEVHVLAFDGDLYGKKIQAEFTHYLREEVKFQNKESLIRQLESDKERAKQLLTN